MATEGKKTTVRLATRADVPTIVALIRELAEFEDLLHACEVTEEKLNSSLWLMPPFQGPTVFMLEIGPVEEERGTGGSSVSSSIPSTHWSTVGSAEKDKESEETSFEQIVREVDLSSPIQDPARESFKSEDGRKCTVAGFVLFFPNYSTFRAKAGYYIEDLYIRKPYRGRGLGSILLKTVAQQAVKLGAARVEWCVLDWNVNAIKFYEGIGATVMPEWRICRLTGKALESCAL